MRRNLEPAQSNETRIELVTITSVSALGEVEGKILLDHQSNKQKSQILVIFNDQPKVSIGDKVLARITASQSLKTKLPVYNGDLIRQTSTNTQKIIGVFKKYKNGDFLIPINKKNRKNFLIYQNKLDAQDGELVEAKVDTAVRKHGTQNVDLVRRFGNSSKAKLASLIAIHEHGIPNDFSTDILKEAELRSKIPISNPSDLTHLPFISIDPSDARDHDDAICAIKDKNNPGGFIIWVAIADVAKYVIPKSELDLESLNRGNSTYFPDLVVPMIPDILSSNVCSLKQGATRASLAVKITIDKQGKKLSHSFFRGVIKNRQAVSYEIAQKTLDNDKKIKKLDDLKVLMQPLYQAYKLLENQSHKRHPLELELIEQEILLDQEGEVMSINSKQRLVTHKLVEEFMILANVCAAETIQKSKLAFLYRVHESPTPEKILNLRTIAKSLNIDLNTSKNIRGEDLNSLLKKSKEENCGDLVSMIILRSMSQAHYNPQNEGHFGLSLPCYTHFTSPIRRYSDILIHRVLIQIHKWEENPIIMKSPELSKIGEHLSRTERRSMLAERDAKDRYLATFLKNRLGEEFFAHINGISRAGIFVRLDQTGADGLIPISSLGDDTYSLDTGKSRLVGRVSRTVFNIGANVLVKLREANPISGGLIFNLIEYENRPLKILGNSKKRPKRKTRYKKK